MAKTLKTKNKKERKAQSVQRDRNPESNPLQSKSK